jgi:Ran GTPase-activating protein (RanGAP) involved in mRNA processing and transport
MIENKNETIRKIKLGNNGLTDKTAKWFLKVFERSNTSLEVLDLSWNKLEYNGGMCIGEIVRRDPNLKIIDLSWNCISKRPPIKEKANADRIKKL